MSEQLAIQVKNIHKTFRIPLDGGSSLKQKIIHFAKRQKGYREFTPLNGVNFEIKKGEFFGIVGRNGSGKSTLLKTIAGIYESDRGSVTVNGKLVPFIELGVGFNPELTGRENVFLNGALLGFSRQEMQDMYEEIVDFAELHDFMEERLKNYSSGMQVRLAFSIAIRAQGDILLLDEVLAVGDEAFQRKCYEYFAQLKADGRTVILVTHNMTAVNRFCTRALFLNEGKVEYIGLPEDVASKYSELNDIRYIKSKNKKDKSDAISEFNLEIDSSAHADGLYRQGDKITVRASWSQEGVNYVGIALMSSDGRYIYGPNTYQDGRKKSKGNVQALTFTATIAPGEYYMKAAVFGRDDTDTIGVVRKGPKLIITKDQHVPIFSGDVYLEHHWGVDD